jgi:hypothetical protein
LRGLGWSHFCWVDFVEIEEEKLEIWRVEKVEKSREREEELRTCSRACRGAGVWWRSWTRWRIGEGFERIEFCCLFRTRLSIWRVSLEIGLWRRK